MPEENIPADILEGYLQRLTDLKNEETILCSDVDLKIAAMENSLQLLRTQRSDLAKPVTEKIQHTRMEIESIMLVRAKTYKGVLGKVSYTSGYDKITYEAKSLEKICAVNEEVNKAISPFRNSSPVGAYVTIKLEEKKEQPREQPKEQKVVAQS